MDSRLFLRGICREGLMKGDKYPFNLPFIQNWNEISFRHPVTCFVGENGSGKSSLLETIADLWGFNLEGGSLNFNFSTYEEKCELSSYLRLIKSTYRPNGGYFLRSESFYNVASKIDELDRDERQFGAPIIDSYGGISLHQQSHGEAFWATVMNRFEHRGLYILDEPEAALSPLRQIALLNIIDERVQRGSQFIIATHSPMLMAYPGSQILQFSQEGIQEVMLEETEHYQIWFDFINRRDKLLRELQGYPRMGE